MQSESAVLGYYAPYSHPGREVKKTEVEVKKTDVKTEDKPNPPTAAE